MCRYTKFGMVSQSQKKARKRAKQAHSITHFYYVLCGFSRPFAYMPDYDRSGCAVVVESVLRILHTDERQATYTYDSPLTHPYLSCEYFTEFHAVSRLAQKNCAEGSTPLPHSGVFYNNRPFFSRKGV